MRLPRGRPVVLAYLDSDQHTTGYRFELVGPPPRGAPAPVLGKPKLSSRRGPGRGRYPRRAPDALLDPERAARPRLTFYSPFEHPANA